MLTIKNTIGGVKAEAIKNASGKKPVNTKKILIIVGVGLLIGAVTYFILNRKKKAGQGTVESDFTDASGLPEGITTVGETIAAPISSETVGEGVMINVPEMSPN
jgi:hypothetical protein